MTKHGESDTAGERDRPADQLTLLDKVVVAIHEWEQGDSSSNLELARDILALVRREHPELPQ